ncbi:LysR substrate-binding domain-containing protein [Roseibium porphyridii]|uniref:LysR substrate-binding domain-containing protein n=1 Tax=Roseibium porphyridii TaxID=2866279 RepID=A0ABY8EZY5_9HYPH|nr:LysR substrate-binding domain-containing protein [Roseibium sp. KMA01]WFE88476.1 LysR substrate-binding domain-containing protein [Roseibium sp. KMA01]
MKFRQLEAFHSLMISGSTVRAAELMQITQPAVSRSIAELEASLGFTLFDRVRGRMVPTTEGQLFFREVSESFKGMDRLRSAAASIRDFGSGHLKVASLSALGAEVVPKAIQDFRRSNPRVRITLQILPSAQVRNQVVDGNFDIGLAADEIDRSGVDTTHFGGFSGVIAMSSHHPLAKRDILGPEDLAGQPMIGLAPEDRARDRFDAILSEAGVSPEYVVETPSSTTTCALALAGDAVGLVNPLVVEGFVARGLEVRPFAPSVNFRSFLLFRPDIQRSKLVRDFTKCLFDLRNAIV